MLAAWHAPRACRGRRSSGEYGTVGPMVPKQRHHWADGAVNLAAAPGRGAPPRAPGRGGDRPEPPAAEHRPEAPAAEHRPAAPAPAETPQTR
jgi:hypothetical protein